VCGCQFPESTNAELSDEHDDRIHDENAKSKRRRRDYIASKMGTGPQPVLETITYQVSDLYTFLTQTGLDFCNDIETKLINMPMSHVVKKACTPRLALTPQHVFTIT